MTTKQQLFDLISGNCHNDKAGWDTVEKLIDAWQKENETLIKIAKFYQSNTRKHSWADRKKYREYLNSLT